jgi:phosphatidylglycerol:prolipoprotein diacylglycerol transferase
MRPTLVSIPIGDHDVGVHTYGLFVALGFAIGIVRFWRAGTRQGMDGGRLLDLAFWGLVAGIVGSRVAFVALNARSFIHACVAPSDIASASPFSGCLAAFRFWEGGLILYGGAIGTGAVAWWFCKRERWSFWKLGDLAAPTLAIGHALGRLGCYFAGCCFGAACHAPWGVSFPRGSVAFDELQAAGAVLPGRAFTVALHPTQLYEAIGEFAIFGGLLWLERRRHRQRVSQAAPGGSLLVYLGAYAALRFVVEVFRGDTARGYLFEVTAPKLAGLIGLPAAHPLILSVSQFVSLVALVFVGVTVARRHPKTHLKPRSRTPAS